MKTEILLSALFFLIGILSGAIIVGYLVYRHLYSHNEIQEEHEEDEIPIGLKNSLERMFGEGNVKVKKINPFDIARDLENAEPINASTVFKTITNKNNFKKDLESRLHKVVNDGSEDYEKATHLRDLIKTIDTWFDERKKWFLDHVGTRVKPSEAECPCEGCRMAVEQGLVIQNEDMALSLFAQENRSKVNQGELRYSKYEG